MQNRRKTIALSHLSDLNVFKVNLHKKNEDEDAAFVYVDANKS